MSSSTSAASSDAASSAAAAFAPPQVAYSAPLTLGEGALWSARDGCLYFVDTVGKKLLRYTPPDSAAAPASEGRTDSVNFGSPVGCMALTTVPHQMLVAAASGMHLFDWSSLQSWEVAPFPMTAADGAAEFRFNDGGVSPEGTFLAGTMALDEAKGQGRGVVFEYALDTAHGGALKCKPVLRNVSISNGIDWTRDGRTVFYIDTPTQQIDRFVWAPEHSITTEGADIKASPLTQRAKAFDFPKEHKHPDGYLLDAADRLWIASFAGGRVTCWTGEGQLVHQVDIPGVSQTTRPALGGVSFSDLYVTTAARDIDLSKEPQAGNLFVVKNAGQGRAQREFKGQIDTSKAGKPTQHKME